MAAVKGGVRWVHLRDHIALDTAFVEAAHRLAERLRAVSGEVLLSVNTRTEVAGALGAGLHLGARGPSVASVRQRQGEEIQPKTTRSAALLGSSAHDEKEGRQAIAEGAHYLFFSPVFPTTSKPGHPGQGLDALSAFCIAFPQVPVFALGGVTPERVAPCLDAGAHGVAVLSGILHAENPSQAAAAYLKALPDE